VVEPRYDELLSLVQAELRKSGFEDIVAAGIVLTGGSSKMEGVVDLAEEIFHMPVRLGAPQYVSGLRYFSAEGGVKGIWERMKTWFQGNF